MTKTYNIEPSGYYLFESLASGRSCYFESNEEIYYYKKLFKRYISDYVEVHKMQLGSEGYRILLRVRSKSVLVKYYKKKCGQNSCEIQEIYLKEPWRIISEQMRIFHSVFVKWVNKKRNRKGVLVQERYSRYFFNDEQSFEAYIKKMDNEKEVKAQRNSRYRVSMSWVKLVDWGRFRGGFWVESTMDKAFRHYVVSKLIKQTLNLHSPPT